MSAETARAELERALPELVEDDDSVGVSPTEHEVSTGELYEIADE